VAKLGVLCHAAMSHETRYLQHVFQEYEEAIAQFTKAAQEGQNPQLKAFASRMLPKLREHQQRAQQLADGQS
jgi:putative membrane protein